MNTAGVQRVRIHLPATDTMPRTRRGVASRIDCPICGSTLKARTHAEVRKALRLHRLDQHTDRGSHG